MTGPAEATAGPVLDWLAHARSDTHRAALRVCPACGTDLRATALITLAMTYRVCECGTPDYGHLVEQLWHRTCVPAAPPGRHREQALLDAVAAVTALSGGLALRRPRTPADQRTRAAAADRRVEDAERRAYRDIIDRLRRMAADATHPDATRTTEETP